MAEEKDDDGQRGEVLPVWVTADIKDALRQLAAKHKSSVSEVSRAFIEAGIKANPIRGKVSEQGPLQAKDGMKLGR